MYAWDKVTKARRKLKTKQYENTEHAQFVKLKNLRRRTDISNRDEIFKKTNGLCSMCSNKAVEIHHTSYYKEGIPICKTCHNLVHPNKKEKMG